MINNFTNKIIITLILMTFLIAGISYFILTPLINQLNQLNNRITASRENLAALNLQQQDISEIKLKKAEIEQKKEEVYALLVSRDKARNFIENIELIADQSNITQEIILSDLPETTEIIEVPISLILVGSYQDILKYLLKLNLLDYQTNVVSLDLNSTDKPLNDLGEPKIKATIAATIIWQGLKQ